LDKRIEDNIPETAIVVLHYINKGLTEKCIKSIRENTPQGNYHIYLVDNNSPEPLKLDGDYSDVTVLRNDSRRSTSGMNRGFYYALYESQYNHKYVVNLDNDIEVHKGWLEPLVKEMDEHSKTGICGGKQWKPGLKDFYSVGSDLTGFIYNNYPTERMEVNWIQGSFVMFRAEMMRMIGLHDTRFLDYCSDSDYCIHALDRGWDVVFVPESSVTHEGGVSYREHPTGDGNEDLPQLISKWFGLKFNSFANIVPINAQDNSFGKVTYKVTNR